MASSGFVLADELLRLQEDELEFEAVDIDAHGAEAQLAIVDRIVDAVATMATAVQDPSMYGACHKLLDSLLSGMSTITEQIAHETDAGQLPALADPLERYAFLLQWLVQSLEKHRALFGGVQQNSQRGAARGADTWTWASSIPAVLSTMTRALRTISDHLWSSAAVRDTFVSRCILRPVMLLQENESYFKSQAIKRGMAKVICLAVKNHGQAFNVQTSIAQSLQYYEHMAEPMAELLYMLRVEYDVERLAEDVLRDAASKTFTSMDSKSPRSYGRFLVRMAELNPHSILKQISLLQKQMDSESYPMRNAMIEVQGHLIKDLAMAQDEVAPVHDEIDEEVQRNPHQKQIDTFFERIFERFLDLTTFVRTKAIQVCAGLCDMPVKFAPQRLEMAALAVRALEDRGSNVRRNAIALLVKLVLSHPYGMMHGGELDAVAWEQRAEVVNAELAKSDAALAFPEQEEEDPSLPERKPRKSVLDLDALAASQQSMTQAEQEKLTKLRLTAQYYADALVFIYALEQSILILVQLLASTNKAEVLESMEFFRIAHEYKIRGAAEGVRAMVHLIWAKDNALVMEDGSQLKGVRSRLIDVYRALYFDPYPNLSRTENVARISRHMMELTLSATLAELTSLEQLFSTMQAEHLVAADVIDKLWEVYASTRPIAKAQRRGAIMVLSMLATADRALVADKIDTLLQIGLGPLGMRDFVLAKHTCIALQRVSGSAKKVKGALSDANVRYPMSHPMFARLRAVVQIQGTDDTWFSAAEHAIQAIYLLGEQPDALASEMLRQLTLVSLGTTADQNPFRIAQFLFVVGHIALKEIVYLESVEREFKRRKAAQDASADQDKQPGSELDQVAGSAEDEVGDMVAFIKDRELLYGPQSLLACFGPMITHICANMHDYPDARIRRAAALSLCKFMCISTEYCEANLALLLHVLKTSNDAVVRANVVIGLGDVAICFGTLVDENSERLYAGLGDADLSVKKNTLMVLTHLILNGMIKVKGQLGELAKCLEDSEPRVSDLAKLFFSELATKENAVYNNLPDIISHLSTGQHAVEEEVFTNTMRFIFTFIDKERQAENVIEKLCQRFRLTTEERQWRDIAFCLSLLPYRSERSVKKLVEALPFYQDKLYSPEVYKRFTEILTKMRQGKSAQAKAGDTDLREFEDVLAHASAQGSQEKALESATNAHLAHAEKRRAPTRPKRGKVAAT
ncbi:Ycs4p [Malassezia vespertilionis]|uniref:Condensin complex subunit 1 n=1 Tax=Malassezia vespertilionis TaxID=2020962 RepID=A0A2N1JBV7_9BASI|nr:Ycs4p [Malassezia vespertilionis]